MLTNLNKLPLNQETINSNISLLIMHIYILLTTEKIQIFKCFSKIISEPKKFDKSFLPSLPHDEDYEIFNEYRKLEKDPFEFYQCSKGHIYTIGDCKKPATVGVCPTCKEPIGGTNHELIAGNTAKNDLNQKVQTGYCSVNPNERDDQPESIRNMGIINTSILRLLLDCVLFISSKLNDQNLIFDSLNSEYFYQQILVDIKKLSNSIHHSPDESLLFIHFILNELKNFSSIQNQYEYKSSLKEKKDRIKFENIFCQLISNNILKNESINNLIHQLTNILTKDAENSDNDQLFRIAYDLVDIHSDNLFLNEKNFWLFRRQITIDNMINTFNNSIENKNKHKLLNYFIIRMKELEAIKYLSSISKMVLLLHSTFNRQIDRKTASSIQLSELIDGKKSINDFSFKEIVKTGIGHFLKALKIVGTNLKQRVNNNLANKLNENDKYLSKVNTINEIDLYKQLPLSYLLPNTSNKDGVYIYSLIVYLAALQNEFIQFFTDLNGSNVQNNQNDFENLNTFDLISFSCEKEIQKFIYINSNYSLEAHNETNLEYDFSKIEKCIENKLLIDKPFIDLKVFLNYLL
jgi:hypothetical protein